MDNKKLKECPFCGSPYTNKPGVRSYYTCYPHRMYFVECTYCGATSRHSASEEEAIKSWNARKDD